MFGAVVDASVVVASLIDDDARGYLVARALDSRDLFAPEVLPFEVLQTLRGLEGRKVPAHRVDVALRAFFRMPVELSSLESVAPRTWELRHNLTAYDASYVALSERLGVPLITLDRHLAGAPGLHCEVIVPA